MTKKRINNLLNKYSKIKYYNLRNTIFDEEEFKLEIKIKKEFLKNYYLNNNKYFFEIFENELKSFDKNYMMREYLNKNDEIKFEKIKFLYEILFKINNVKSNQILKKYKVVSSEFEK